MKFSRFRFEYTEELSSEEFKKIEEKFEKKAMEIFEKETAYINFRTLDDIDTIFEEIYGDVALTLDKLQSKHPIQTLLWIDEKLKILEKYLSEEQAVKNKIAENLSNLTINYTKDEIRLINLYSNMFTELYQTMHFLEKSLFWERHHRKSHLVKILRVFNGIMLVNLRIMELDRHWMDLEDEEKDLMENFIIGDIDTLANTTQSLDEFKKDIKIRKRPNKELLLAIWG